MRFQLLWHRVQSGIVIEIAPPREDLDTVDASENVPDVSIVVAVHNDEGWIAAALDSCVAQTWSNLEVICVDDASIDGTREVVREFVMRDPRVHLVEQATNQSAFQARKVGIGKARAKYVLFLDGDDELAPEAVSLALETARSEDADVVGFGVEVVAASGDHPGRFESDLQHKHRSLFDQEILPSLFPVGSVAQGHIWRYLWSVELLRTSYAMLPSDLVLYRANDLPIVFLSLASAKKYVSIEDRLYRYWFRRGGSGNSTVDRPTFRFYLSALDSIESIEESILDLSSKREDPTPILDSYASARMSVVQVILRYGRRVQEEHQSACLSMLADRVGAKDVIQAASTFFTDSLEYLARNRHVLTSPGRQPVRNVLVVAGNLSSGGVQGVVVSQAKHLRAAGFGVVVAVRTIKGVVHDLPEDVPLVEIQGDSTGSKVSNYLNILSEYEIDLSIDHWILYKDDWPFFALAASAVGVSTIGWLHNFALRPIFDFNTRTSFLTQYLPLLREVVTLSSADVAFWKLRGILQTVYLPNPPSPMLLDRPIRTQPRSLNVDRPLRLVWWGRIQQHTKRVRDLIEVAASLQALDVRFELTIIGPDSADLSAAQLNSLAEKRGVGDVVGLPGPLHGDELWTALSQSDVYVCTSAIEGYPLTLIEAQAMGLPVAMYELPWLAVAQDNSGLATVRQGDPDGLAREIAGVGRDQQRYHQLSRGSLQAASAALNFDFAKLNKDLIAGELDKEFSPDPTAEMTALLLDRSISFQEENSGREKRYQRRILNQLASKEKETKQLSRKNRSLSKRVSDSQEDLRRLRNWIDKLKEGNKVQQQEVRRMRAWNLKLRDKTKPQPKRSRG